MVQRKKSYQLLICRVAKNLPAPELLNHFIKSSTVAYKRVAYKRNLIYMKKCFFQTYTTAILHFFSFFIVVNVGLELFVKTHMLLYFCNETRSSHQRCFMKAAPENFTIFTRKPLCWSLFLVKLQVFRSAILLKRDSNTGVFLWILQNI